ncbi:MAG: polysaccharide biosynthesis C-terminal domain-containing protein [Treponema sp.]
MNEGDQVKTNSLVFEYLGVISFICTMAICIIAHPLYKLLFTEEYVIGYIISPYLFLAPLLQMLFQVAANQFLVIKKTWPNMLILSSGAVLNVILNLILIPRFGIEGAAIATLAGYFVADVVCVIVLFRMKLIIISIRFILMTITAVAFILIWRIFFLEDYFMTLGMLGIFFIVLYLLYRQDIKKILQKGKKNGKNT